MKKLLLILTLTALLTLLIACTGEVTTAVTTTDTPGTDTTPTENTTTEAAVKDTTEITTAEITTEDSNVLYKDLKNPIYPTGNDPWIVEHNGKYYYCYSGGQNGTGGVRVNEIDSIDKVTTFGYSQVYVAPQGTMYSHEYWAPELHYIQGEWYIYVAADDGNNNNHRMYVLKGTSQVPTDPFEMVGKITDPTDKWAIDGTVLTVGDELYFVWSGWEGNENVAQNIYIAHMSDPCTIDSERTLLSAPTYIWERIGNPTVNEGPTALYHGDRAFIVYSASGSWTDNYCLGLLSLTGNDPLDSNSWQKSTNTVFRMRRGVAYGPGHCSFSTAVDGSNWMIYHANLEAGTGWDGRSVWISPVTFDEKGNPIFGQPEFDIRFPYALKES
ncbi:MAG: glycoside hydrolase family 43 protein [Clostridia bacterium]|nr:glycoside hydrolase family 43 protein [Clostridia bacterium]